MDSAALFSILDSVESTNNYAMAMVHAGLAKDGMAWFAHHQTRGKGQRGKQWDSAPGDNIILSVALIPPPGTEPRYFHFNAAVAIICCRFMHKITGFNFKIKWPNDIYWNDRKAAGILIENVIRGNSWNWCVVGIGINVNQLVFPGLSKKAVSLKEITGKSFDTVVLAQQLHIELMNLPGMMASTASDDFILEYNSMLYKRGETIQLRKDNVVFNTLIKEVDRYGNLHTTDGLERNFMFGEVEWIIT